MHFSLGVITRTGTISEITKLLKPYDAETFNSSYIYETKEKFIKRKREEYLRHINSDDYLEYLKDKTIDFYYKRIYKGLESALKLSDDDFIQYVKKVEKLPKKFFDKDNNHLYLYNSKALFDEWSIGGKYYQFLRLNNGSRDCVANLSEIVWKSDEERINSFRDLWKKIVIQDTPITDKLNDFYLRTKEDLLRIYGTENNFLKAYSMMVPRYILTPDGKLHGPIFRRTENLINPALEDITALHQILSEYADCHMTILDCHE